jgi:hypothetical protein
VNRTEEMTVVEEDIAEEAIPRTYENDRGTLPLEIRKLLIVLLRGPYLLSSDAANWNLLLQNRDLVLQQLGNIFLSLTIDELNGVAYICQADTGEVEAPTLLSSFSYKLLDSVLIVEMRDRLMKANQAGERAAISTDEIVSLLTFFDPASKDDQTRFVKRVVSVITRCKDRHFLLPVSKDTYEISPILKVVFGASQIQEMKESYQRLIDQALSEDVDEKEFDHE